MNEFSAYAYFRIGNSLGLMNQMLPGSQNVLAEKLVESVKTSSETAALACDQIGMKISAKALRRMAKEVSTDWDFVKLGIRSEELKNILSDEMESHLFLWVPSHRAEWYSKDAEAILGIECCNRFSAIQREVEEAAKCYAAGRYTATAFHLTRSTEAGVKALAKAIGYVPPNDNWTLVFRQMGNEFKLPHAQRSLVWQTHGDFLEEIWADLRAVSKAWRNDIAHLVDTYTEDEARGLLDVIPLFLRHLATKMDENGKLY